jgi:hypothetical protein
MKLAAVVVVAVLGCGGAPVARAPNAPAPGAVVKYPEALAMMERFLAAPFADPADTERVKTFVAHNHDVLVIIDAAAAPYVDEDLDPEARSLLLSGLAAGSAASQLRAGTRGDDLDGAEALYRQSLAISPDDTKATQELEYVQGLRARRK